VLRELILRKVHSVDFRRRRISSNNDFSPKDSLVSSGVIIFRKDYSF
jgi:hypothetical protein